MEEVEILDLILSHFPDTAMKEIPVTEEKSEINDRPAAAHESGHMAEEAFPVDSFPTKFNEQQEQNIGNDVTQLRFNG